MGRAENAAAAGVLADAGLSSSAIASELGLSYSYIRELLTDPTGERLRRRHDRARRPCEVCGQIGSWPGGRSITSVVVCQACIMVVAEEKAREVGQMYGGGMSTFDIAEVLGLPQQSIWRSLLRSGVKPRSKSEACRMAWVKKKAAVA